MASIQLGHIRTRYNVPAYRYRRVWYDGRAAIVRKALGCFLRLQFEDDGSLSGPIHPLDISYDEPEDMPKPAPVQRAPFHKFVRY